MNGAKRPPQRQPRRPNLVNLLQCAGLRRIGGACTALTELDLSYIAGLAGHSLSGFPALRRLAFVGVDPVPAALAAALMQLTQLTHLELSAYCLPLDAVPFFQCRQLSMCNLPAECCVCCWG